MEQTIRATDENDHFLELDLDEESFLDDDDVTTPHEISRGVNSEISPETATKPHQKSSQISIDNLDSLFENLVFSVTAEDGQVLFPLIQLISMQPGDVFDLAELPPRVNLVINGKIFGCGYLVELNGRVGLRVASIEGLALTPDEKHT